MKKNKPEDCRMHGHMMDTPLLISSIAKHAERFHGDREIVSVTMDDPRHRYTVRDAMARAPGRPRVCSRVARRPAAT